PVFTVNGRNPTPPSVPGDALNLDLTGTTVTGVTATGSPAGYSGTATFTNRQSVNFAEIETLNPAPVSVIATDPSAAETGIGQPPNPGRFVVSRVIPGATPLTVSYRVGGTATNGVDYAALSGSVVI